MVFLRHLVGQIEQGVFHLIQLSFSAVAKLQRQMYLGWHDVERTGPDVDLTAIHDTGGEAVHHQLPGAPHKGGRPPRRVTSLVHWRGAGVGRLPHEAQPMGPNSDD